MGPLDIVREEAAPVLEETPVLRQTALCIPNYHDDDDDDDARGGVVRVLPATATATSDMTNTASSRQDHHPYTDVRSDSQGSTESQSGCPPLSFSQKSAMVPQSSWRTRLRTRLYHRKELETMLAQELDTCLQSPSRLTVLSGPVGAGKTRLVQTCFHQKCAGEGYFLTGTFDSLSATTPY